jgi:CBS domain containing-hemolysin-like protein
MEPHSFSLVGILAALLAASAFFAVAETAFSSLNKIRLKHLASEGNRKAAVALAILEKFDKFISTVLIGNNIVNILLTSLATVFFVSRFGTYGVTISTIVVTVLLLIFGEITPKTIARESPERFAFSILPAVRAIMFLLTPVNFLITLWRNCIIKLFKIHPENKITENELLTFVEEVRQVGGINESEERMIRNVIEFDDLTANDILIPRIEITGIAITDSIEAIARCFYETNFSRLPIYRTSIDDIVGIIIHKDFSHKVLKDKQPLESIIKPVLFISKTMEIPRLLKKLQKEKTHLAVVLDEYGGTLGIITIEDIVEEVVGEIWDEHDEITKNIVAVADGFRVNGTTPIKDFFEALKIDDKDLAVEAVTVGGWVIDHGGSIPKEGHQFPFNDFVITITKIENNRIMEVLVKSARKAKKAES